jgi:hypothetical protein
MYTFIVYMLCTLAPAKVCKPLQGPCINMLYNVCNMYTFTVYNIGTTYRYVRCTTYRYVKVYIM